MVFPRKNFKDFMCKNTPTGTLGLAAPTGWMNSDLFPKVIKHFVKHTNSSPENQSILILDNHESHLSIEALDLAKASGVHILTIHPHTSGKLQPLDVAIFSPFKTYYNAAIDSWMLRNPGKPVTIYDIGELVASAFFKVMTPSNITNAFKKCGIFPFDRFVYNDDDFLPSSVTDRPCTDCSIREENMHQISRAPLADTDISSTLNFPTSRLIIPTTDSASGITVNSMSVVPSHGTPPTPPNMLTVMDNFSSITSDQLDNIPGIIGKYNSNGNTSDAIKLSSSSSGMLITEGNSRISPERIVPKPSSVSTPLTPKGNNNTQAFISPFDFREPIKAGPRKSNRKRRRLGRSIIATDTPEKAEIEMEKAATKRKKALKRKKVSRKVMDSDSDEDAEIDFQDSEDDYDSDSIGEKENNVSILTHEDLQQPLPGPPQEGEYVLVEFATKKKVLYYVGKILQTRNRDLEYQISFLRQNHQNKFRVPNVPDISFVKEDDVKLILPKPICSRSTSRQQSFYSFPLDLSALNVN
nr:unnamed protein product [Callosobruchus analis]